MNLSGLLLAALSIPGAAWAASPFFAFAASQDPGVVPVLQQYFQKTDYLGVKTLAALPALRTVVAGGHQIDLEPSVAGVQQIGCDPGTAVTVFYQWGAAPTPEAEQADPVGSSARAIAAIRGNGCQVGLAPEPQFFGYQPGTCAYNPDAGSYRQVDWSTVDFLDIQGEPFLEDTCVGQAGVNPYVNFVTAVAAYVRARNPRIVIAAQLSFRFTPPAVMTEAVHAMGAVVDGFLLSYPLNPAQEHKYCAPQNLAAFLGTVRPAAVLP